METLRVLELYCGIGGMHFALQRLDRPYEIVAAFEINPTVLDVYTHNFPNTNANNRNILGLSIEELNDMKLDLIVMSPPCQPFCRSGLKLDKDDKRTDSLCHLLSILPKVSFRFLLLENVKGFENSCTHSLLLKCLTECRFEWQEFLISPVQLGIPNSRLRYYLLGKRHDLPWSFPTKQTIHTDIPGWSLPIIQMDLPYKRIIQQEHVIWQERRRKLLGHIKNEDEQLSNTWCVGDIIGLVNENMNSIPVPIRSKYTQAMDIVNIYSTSTNCFTKSYGTFVKGTGSVFKYISPIVDSNNQEKYLDNDIQLQSELRFFTPSEVSRLMCFPDSFKFPPNTSTKQQYKGLGNSINVYVVAILMSLLNCWREPLD